MSLIEEHMECTFGRADSFVPNVRPGVQLISLTARYTSQLAHEREGERKRRREKLKNQNWGGKAMAVYVSERVGEERESEGKVVGPGVANHHTSAHGMAWSTFLRWMDGWIGRRREERERERVKRQQCFISIFSSHTQMLIVQVRIDNQQCFFVTDNQ
jgi:hypothetical protein